MEGWHEPNRAHEGFDVLQLVHHLISSECDITLLTLLVADVAAKANTTVKDRNPSSTLGGRRLKRNSAAYKKELKYFRFFSIRSRGGQRIQFGLLWGSLSRANMKRNFLGILTTMALALLISVPLSAQTIARVTVPFDFTVGQTQMSAGTYEINSLAHGAIVIRDTKAAKSA